MVRRMDMYWIDWHDMDFVAERTQLHTKNQETIMYAYYWMWSNYGLANALEDPSG